MPPFRATLPQSSGLWEKCARHTSPSTARALQYIYLCDPCALRMTQEAFNDRPPVRHGETVEGFCGLCNALQPVTMRQWFVCPICWNVVVAYQKSIAASKYVHSWWADNISPHHPEFVLTETEPVYLAPYAQGGKTKRTAAVTLEKVDFLVTKTSRGVASPLFHIEQKTGPGSIETMKEFQLDVNDFNDVAGVVNLTGLPSYLFHVQAQATYALPTRGTVVTGMWWTDVYRLMDNKRGVKARRGDDKDAIYYAPAAFEEMATFVDQLATEEYGRLQKRVKKAPIPFV